MGLACYGCCAYLRHGEPLTMERRHGDAWRRRSYVVPFRRAEMAANGSCMIKSNGTEDIGRGARVLIEYIACYAGPLVQWRNCNVRGLLYKYCESRPVILDGDGGRGGPVDKLLPGSQRLCGPCHERGATFLISERHETSLSPLGCASWTDCANSGGSRARSVGQWRILWQVWIHTAQWAACHVRPWVRRLGLLSVAVSEIAEDSAPRH
jgi:hypothetical protein